MKFRFLGGLTAAAMTASLIPAAAIVAYAETETFSESKDGYDYFWENTDDTGTINMDIGSNGSFEATWSSVEDCEFRCGKELGSTHPFWDYGGIQFNYNVDYKTSGNSSMGYCCTFSNPKSDLYDIEVYIIEAWGDWRPPGMNTPLNKVVIDGKSYDIYEKVEYEDIGDERLPVTKYYSVRQSNPAQVNVRKNLIGTVTVSEHLKEMKDLGLNVNGNLKFVGFFVNGYRSNGTISVKKNQLPFGLCPIPDYTDEDTETPDNGSEDTTVIEQETIDTEENNTEKAGPFRQAVGTDIKVGHTVSVMDIRQSRDNTIPSYKEYFDYFTPAYELYPDSIIDKDASTEKGNNVDTQITLHNADEMLKYCEENNIPIFGGPFVFSSQTPDWFFREDFNAAGAYVSKEVMRQRLESLIKNTFEAIKKDYPDLKICGYEVCMDMFESETGEFRHNSGNCWYKTYQDDDYIIDAYKFARQYAPEGTKLFYSDFNEYIPEKTMGIFKLATELRDMELLDGIGMEAYLSDDYPDKEEFRTALETFSETGLDIQLTHFQVHGKERQKKYADIISLCREYSDRISGINFDYISGHSWDDGLTKPDMELINSYLEEANNDKANAEKADGDANGDGSFNIADVVLVQQSLLNANKYKISEIEKVDYDNDGELTVFDLCIMKSELLNKA